MTKETRKMCVQACPVDRLEEITNIFKKYSLDETTVTVEPVIYKITGEISKEQTMKFYNEIDKIDKELEENGK